MTMTDPIADMLTRMRNAIAARKKSVGIPASKLKTAIADVLQREGYISGYEIAMDGRQGQLNVTLKYDGDGVPAISSLERRSKPGRRVYGGFQGLPKVLGGLGICVLSTPKGVLSDREARRERVGGELLCSVS